MNKNMRSWGAAAIVVTMVLLLGWVVSTALAQGPDVDGPARLTGGSPTETFTYQGQLMDGGQLANGVYDFKFSVWDAETLGNMVSNEFVYDIFGITVEDGLFTVGIPAVPYGEVFNGPPRWLDMQVRPHGVVISYTVLPRQPFAASPYAWGLRAGAVVTGTALGSAYGEAVLNVGNSGGATTTAVIARVDEGIGVYGVSFDSGIGLQASSDSGVGLRAYSSTGNPIEAWDYTPYDRVFYVDTSGDVYANGAYNCALGPGGEPGTCIVQNSPADFAEMLPATQGLEAGDVLVIDLDGELALSTEPYQATVVGVYSTQPGYLGGGDHLGDADYAPLALVGVVPVKASAENGAIVPGDLLVSSSTAGHAMAAGESPLVGTVIGKALEGLESGTGVIQMLVMLQ
jgi:hypothetical protein